MDYNVTLIDDDLEKQDIIQCIICLDDYYTNDNRLNRGNEVFVSECDCNYLVHSKCIAEWINIKGSEQVCINCNSNALLKNIEVQLDATAYSASIKTICIVIGIAQVTALLLYKIIHYYVV
jgi:hypothetical protein